MGVVCALVGVSERVVNGAWIPNLFTQECDEALEVLYLGQQEGFKSYSM